MADTSSTTESPPDGATNSEQKGHDTMMDIFHYLNARLNIKNERGAALVEYALLLALIAVVCIVAIGAIGSNANDKFSEIGSSLQ